MSFTHSRNLTITQRFSGCIESLAKMEDHTHVVGTHMKVSDCGNEGWLNPDLRDDHSQEKAKSILGL